MLRLLTGELHADAGHVKRGTTLQIGHLSQALAELGGADRVLDAVENRRRVTRTGGRTGDQRSTLLEDFGFTGDKLTTRLDDLSGGERRRLQFLRLLLDEPNVLLLDEPTNDLDIDTLTVIEDYLDAWPGTLIVVTHDRYFLERVCDVTYALIGDGRAICCPAASSSISPTAKRPNPRPAAERRSVRSRCRHASDEPARKWPASKGSSPNSTNASPRCTRRWRRPRRITSSSVSSTAS